MKEVWKTIDGFDDMYGVSDHGSVKNLITEHVLTQKPDKDGYMLVGLFYQGKPITKKVHRLVAEAFIPNPMNKPTVNHINEVKDDNHLENLEWATYFEQIHHGRRDERARKSIYSEPIYQMDADGNIIRRYESVREAAKAVGRKPELIVNCLKGRSQTSAGFFWKYENGTGAEISGPNKNLGVVQMMDDGTIVNRFSSIQAAARAIGISASGICLCLAGKRKSAAGYIWRYDDVADGNDEYASKLNTEKMIPILQLDEDGNFLCQHPSVSAAAKSVHKSTGSICRCLKGRRKTCGGYQWKYA